MGALDHEAAFSRYLTGGHLRLGIVGMGYVGLPLALAFAEHHSVVGFDTSAMRNLQLQAGRSPFRHVSSGSLRQALRAKRLHVGGNMRSCHAVVICVPTPLGTHREPDLSHVRTAAQDVGQSLVPGQLVVLESTTYPGTTEEVLVPILEAASGLKAGVDFHVAYSPEREDPGNARFGATNVPKVVAGLTPACQRMAAQLYGTITKTVAVSSVRVAETTKLYENIFRCVNIALANEMKLLCEAMGLDVWEVIEAASTKPFGFMPFYPGPGLGGHCIPVDPFYLSWKAREFGQTAKFIELAGEVNAAMPAYVVGRLERALSAFHVPLGGGATVVLVGVAYKADVEDTRESPAIRIVRLLRARQVVLSFYDPHVSEFRVDGVPVNCLAAPELLRSVNAAVIVTAHSDVDHKALLQATPVVVDTRHTLRSEDVPKTCLVSA